MQKREFLYREILFQVFENNLRVFTQSSLSSKLGISLSNTNHALKPLKRMGAIEVNPRNFVVVNPKKVLFYWASIRNLERDMLFSGRVDLPVREIEKSMPDSVVFGAFSAFWFRFGSAPADYSEVYVYGSNAEELKKRFILNAKNPNLFVLKKDPLMGRYGKISTIAQTFVDLWNLSQWYAKDFLRELEGRIDAVLA